MSVFDKEFKIIELEAAVQNLRMTLTTVRNNVSAAIMEIDEGDIEDARKRLCIITGDE